MKKLLTGFIVAMMVLPSAIAQNRSVNFEHITFTEALAKAKAENKLIFMDGFADWCGPCKYMASKVFTQDQVADFLNANFINVKYDMEKGEGRDLAKRYEVKAFPTFLILDTAGNMIHRIVGGDEADPFVEKVKVGMNPTTSLKGMMDKYNGGNRDAAFVRDYLNTLQTAYMQPEAEGVAQEYIRSLSEEQRTNKENWAIYTDFVNDPTSKDFVYILTNRLKFIDAVGDSAVNAKIDDVFFNTSLSYLINRRGTVYTKEKAAKIRDIVSSSRVAGGKKYLALIDMADAKASKNGKLLTAQVESYIKDNQPDDRECYTILSQTIPTVSDNAGKSEWVLLSKIVGDRLAVLKEERARPTLENLKQNLDDKIKEAK